jgi:hypothetical protein
MWLVKGYWFYCLIYLSIYQLLFHIITLLLSIIFTYLQIFLDSLKFCWCWMICWRVHYWRPFRMKAIFSLCLLQCTMLIFSHANHKSFSMPYFAFVSSFFLGTTHSRWSFLRAFISSWRKGHIVPVESIEQSKICFHLFSTSENLEMSPGNHLSATTAEVILGLVLQAFRADTLTVY